MFSLQCWVEVTDTKSTKRYVTKQWNWQDFSLWQSFSSKTNWCRWKDCNVSCTKASETSLLPLLLSWPIYSRWKQRYKDGYYTLQPILHATAIPNSPTPRPDERSLRIIKWSQWLSDLLSCRAYFSSEGNDPSSYPVRGGRHLVRHHVTQVVCE